MRSTSLKATLTTAALVSAGVLLTAGSSPAATVDVYLRAESSTKTLPGGALVPMWGFVCASGSEIPNPNCVSSASGPPRINAAAGDSLIIHLTNTLPTPVSIVIPGQAGGGDPVTATDGLGRSRVRSFTHETAASGGTNTYSFAQLRPGTYLYQSGTHPSIQVPMGLYGALVVGPATGVTCTPPKQPAYGDVDSCYDTDAVLLFSEIDAAQNAAVDAAAGDADSYPSTVNYNPTWFLINGEPYNGATPPAALPAGTPGNSVLLRFLNAGLRSHNAAIVGLDMGLIAEDGNLYPGVVKQQASALLPAGKTLDVLVAMPAVNATYPLFDRMLDLSNDNQPYGGMLAYLQVGTGSAPPPPSGTYAVNDSYAVPEDAAPYAGASVLVNDVGLAGATVTVVSEPANGSLLLNSATGTFTYTPNANFSGADGFSYSASLAGNSYPAQVTLNVSFVNDAPVAAADGPYVNIIGGAISVDAAHGVLGNDSDPDGDTLTAVLVAGPGVTLAADGSFTYAGASGSFSYSACDRPLVSGVCPTGSASTAVTVTVNINPVAGIALIVKEPGASGATVTAYRWLVQEDATYHINPAAPPAHADTLSTNLHKSYMPVLAQGCVGSGCAADNPRVPVAAFSQAALDPTKHYYVSVLPNDAGTGAGHSIGGAPIPAPSSGAGFASPVTVIVNQQPIPAAQISVFVFEDIHPTNGAPDPPEPGLGGFQIVLEDAGGRYGISGGTMSQDVYGNPLKNSLACAPPASAGVILTCPDGTALIKDLAPGKYGVIAVAPAGAGRWTQTSTIEGTKVQDSWVKAGEPPFLVEFGAPGYHAFIGFVKPDNLANPGGSNTITGDITVVHSARPPSQEAFDSGSYDALGHTRAWIGVNSGAGGGPNIKTVQADPDGHFSLSGIPDGTHQLVIWDDYLDQIIHYRTVILPGGGDVGNIPVPTWFGRHEHNVFLDTNGNGVRDDGELGLPDQNVNLRFRDGTVFQSFPTDTEGFVPFDQIFPFGSWQVAEVDYTRHKATGVTVTVDGGGAVSGGPYPGLLNPQVGTPRTDTEPAPVLLQGFQSMPGMTSIFEWGKKPYERGENGGISGIVFYGSTRGENDPRLTVGDPWEPGIANVKVRLYREVEKDGGEKALVLVQEVQTDSWDAATPTGCEGEAPTDPFVTQTLGGDRTRCYDGVRNFEQVRPGAVFDGGYAFTGIPPGKYVVEVVPPPGYELYKEEDKNVDFGDSFETLAPVAAMLPGGAMLMVAPDQAMVLAAMGPEPGLAQPPCVGPDHLVPMQLSLFPGVDTYAPFAGTTRPLCNRKQVILSDQGQAAADFHLFTSTPVAGQFQGLTTDDIAVETNLASPNFSDKWGPAFLPFSMRDFNGQEIYRSYTDAFGRYNGLVPSTYTANNPIPSGYSPGMHFVCLNDPGNGPVPDPLTNPNYGTFCYTLMYMPGTTTYLDTPLLPQAAFAAGFNSVDCAFPDGTPVITEVRRQTGGPGNFGPWIPSDAIAANRDLIISSPGTMQVPNPAYEGPLAPAPYNQPTITRDFGFGTVEGTVTVGGTPVPIVGGGGWSNGQIRIRMPVGSPGGELVVTRANGRSSVNTVTVTVSSETPIRVPAGGSLQAAIDAAAPGSLILVGPGVYEELVVLWKPLRLQGSGAGTVINAVKRPTEKLDAWRAKVKGLIDGGLVDLVPGQPAEFDLVGPGLFGTELGAGITVLAKNDPGNVTGRSFLSGANPSRIDGFTITGADGGGGIFVNGYAHNLEIANNRVNGNSGVLHGGIRVGHPYLAPSGGPFGYNRNLNIHHNEITLNGGQDDNAVGGGLALCTGTDNYSVSRNYICGNFTLGDGAGIGHVGLSDNGQVLFNQILFNQTFNQGRDRSGGGVLIAGEPAAAGLTLGAGDVTVDANLIQGNQAGSGHGGGIRTEFVNGTDATGTAWSLTITNNMIVNNVAGWSGGGISLQDTVNASIINNTITNNDTTATVGGLVAGNNSTPQPAGISSDRHSLGLAAALPGDDFSNPTLFNNIVWHNRAFSYDATTGNAHLEPVLTPSAVGGCPTATNYWDLGVLGEPFLGPALQLNPTYSILTSTAGYDGSNIVGDPAFLKEYCNGARTLSAAGPMQVAAEVIEGGNFIDVRYGPLTQAWPAASAPWNYHVGATSAGLNNGNNSGAPNHDFDNQARPQQSVVDRGADEAATTVTPPATGIVVTSPADGATLSGAVPLAATVTGTGVVRVQFLVGTTVVATDLLASGGWTGTWNTAFADNGARVITARSCSNLLGTCTVVATSAPVNVTVNNTISVTAPASGATLSGAVPLVATVSATSGFLRLQFLAGTTVVATDVLALGGWTGTWNTAFADNGARVITARTCSNLIGACTVVATSAPVNVTVNNTISVTAPASGATLSGAVALAATVGATGVGKVQFLVGTTIVATDGSAAGGWTGTWNTSVADNGARIVTARACSNGGGGAACTLLATSAPVNVTVSNP